MSKMEIKIYDVLPPEAMQFRITVFVEVQGFKDEIDKIDDIAVHLVAFDGETAVATCRLFEEDHKYIIGRLAVIRQYRGKHIGADLLRAAESIVQKNKGSGICLHAQVSAKAFYEKQGYAASEEIDYEENCPHVWMRKKMCK